MRRMAWVGIGTILLLSAGCGRVGGEPFQPSLNAPVPVEADSSVGQILNPAGGSVRRIDLSVATFAQMPDPEGVLTVTLEGASGPRETEVSGADITDGAWVAASFDPPVVVDDLAEVRLSWEGATPLAVWSNRTLEGTVEIENDPYAGGQLVVDGRPTDGDLAFRVVTTGGSAVGQLVEVARGAGARLLDQLVFALVWLVLLGGAGLLVALPRRAA